MWPPASDSFFKNSHDVTIISDFSVAYGGQNRNYNLSRFTVFTVNTEKNVERIGINFMLSVYLSCQMTLTFQTSLMP